MTDHTATSLNETGLAKPAWARAAAPWAFGGAMLLSAALVFSLQPMFAKMVLPRVGGGAAVWTVALVFFQGALLAGYSYAHFLTSHLSFARQIIVHACVLLLAAFFLPIAVAGGFEAPPDSGQGLWLIALFSASVGAPFAAVSATAPLLQSWFARTGRADAGDPYYLYGASNLGSLAALLAFPLLIEPALGANAQSVTWSLGFGLLGAAIMGCAVLVWRTGASLTEQPHAVAGAVAPWMLRAKWALFGLLPSALLVAATTHISTDVASAPLLWVIPLALYLSAFILAFNQRTWVPAKVAAIALPALAAVTLVTGWSAGDWRILSVTVLGTLWLGTYVCCRALYEIRPEARLLTDFYLWMSLGGVVGGALTALVAPVVFHGVLEWPIAVAFSLLALPGGKTLSRPMLIIFGACLAITLLAALLAALNISGGQLVAAGLVAGLSAIIVGRDNRMLMTLACAAIILMGATIQHRGVSFADRSFYGAVRVTDDGPWRRFVHGTTLHGVQSLDPELAHTPTGYYGPLTPIGSTFTALNNAGGLQNVAVLGLGAGAMACHARAGQSWTFYEIDPLVVQVAQDRRLFTFLSDCTPDAQVIVGDARLELAMQPRGAYDLVAADAFSSDAVPTHLITAEAMRLYLDSVDEDGVVLVHVSNRNLAMADVAARAGLAAGAVVIQRLYLPEERSYANFGSQVVAMARTREALEPLLADPAWQMSAPPPGRAWTDDYSNILEPLIQRIQHPLQAH
ncbi:spermidine synthase [Terricaulis silvestris]|uniref:Spermidine synthase n=1 Tax=Terricaulis silvestris TaxID=2686094 RepID=A0A6I6MWK0_9CAUL|nr:fused MFS/spermidine synthase [Terricaulis silvestris]QGZ96002.1 Spermidine synthase [Terricaulis silvestris]